MATDNADDNASEEFLDLVENYSELFDRMSQERHDMGSEKYGNFTFLENDTGRMLMEELVDASNYARYLFIKIGLLNDVFLKEVQEARGAEEATSGGFKLGIQGFVGTKEGWEDK